MLLKKITFSICLIFIFSTTVYAANKPTISASSAVVINAQTKEVIFEKNAHKQRSMASTTKIMTSLLAIESGKLNCKVKAENFSAEGTSIGLKDGYVLLLKDLVYGMMLESGNDAAKLTANFLAGNEKSFASLMNTKAKEIGMINTSFATASGLDDELHYSTAYDMALLASYAVNNPVFEEISSTKSIRVNYIEPKISVTFSNHNKLLNLYDDTIGVKTGFTKKSGRCLVSACRRNGNTLVAVTLNAPDDWNDHIKLYDYAFSVSKANEIALTQEYEISVQGGSSSFIKVEPERKICSIFQTFNYASLEQILVLPEFVYAPIKVGDKIGEIQIYSGDNLVERVALVSSSDVSVDEIKQKITLYEKVTEFIKSIFNLE